MSPDAPLVSRDPTMQDEAQTEIVPIPVDGGRAEPRERTSLVAHAPAFLCGRPLGEILRETAKLTPERIEEALALQRGEQAGTRLGEILVRLKAVTEEDVLRALAIQLDLPFIGHIQPETVPADLAAKVPIHFAKQARVLPLGMAGDAVRVAVADPLDTAVQDSVAMLLGAHTAFIPGQDHLAVVDSRPAPHVARGTRRRDTGPRTQGNFPAGSHRGH